jgi:hypothetical protein
LRNTRLSKCCSEKIRTLAARSPRTAQKVALGWLLHHQQMTKSDGQPDPTIRSKLATGSQVSSCRPRVGW